MTRIDSAISDIRAFVARNERVAPVREEFPFAALQSCAGARGTLPVDALVPLVALLDVAIRYDDAVDGRGRNCYEGDDLRRQAAVVAALAHCQSEDVENHITVLLRSVMRDRHHATPGSPDIDKYDRDVAVERAEDHLALACTEALARWGSRSAEAVAALRAARDHRHDEVRTVARLVLDAAGQPIGER